MIDLSIVELIWIPLSLLIGWLHLRQNTLEVKIDTKLDKDDIHSLTECMADIKKILTEVRIEVAKWVGKLEGQEKKTS